MYVCTVAYKASVAIAFCIIKFSFDASLYDCWSCSYTVGRHRGRKHHHYLPP